MEGEGAQEATPLSEELLEVSGWQESEEDIFFSGVGTGELAMREQTVSYLYLCKQL